MITCIEKVSFRPNIPYISVYIMFMMIYSELSLCSLFMFLIQKCTCCAWHVFHLGVDFVLQLVFVFSAFFTPVVVVVHLLS